MATVTMTSMSVNPDARTITERGPPLLIEREAAKSERCGALALLQSGACMLVSPENDRLRTLDECCLDPVHFDPRFLLTTGPTLWRGAAPNNPIMFF
ncbi:hypothetical protein HpMS107_16720 [Helicobacter pylori]